MNCAMNGQSLTALDDTIRLMDVQEDGADMSITTCEMGGRDGTRFLRKRRTCLTVQVILQVRERNPMRRMMVLEKIASWCRDGLLTVDNRPNQRLNCVCVQGVEGISSVGWADTVTLVFRAYGLPWWESIVPCCVTLSDGEEAVLRVGGTAESTWAEAEVTAKGKVNSLAITCGDSALRFTELAMQDGEKLLITWNWEGIQRIVIQGETERSALPNRTADSSDELTLPQRKSVPIRVEADGAVMATIKARGRYV